METKTITAREIHGENGTTVLTGDNTAVIDFIDMNNGKKCRYTVNNVFNEADARDYIQFCFCGYAKFSDNTFYYHWN